MPKSKTRPRKKHLRPSDYGHAAFRRQDKQEAPEIPPSEASTTALPMQGNHDGRFTKSA